jgi:hypothetical protein
MTKRLAKKLDDNRLGGHALSPWQEPLPPYELDPMLDNPVIRNRIGELIAKAAEKRFGGWSLRRRWGRSRCLLLWRSLSISSRWCLLRRWRSIDVAQDGRQPVLAAADDHDLGIGRLRELKRRLDAAPTQVGVRNALTDDLLEFADPFCLDPLALRLPYLTLVNVVPSSLHPSNFRFS